MRVHLATQVFSPKVIAGLRSSGLANAEEIKYLEIGGRIRKLLLLRTSKFDKNNYKAQLVELRSIIKYFTDWLNDTSIVDNMSDTALDEMKKTVERELKIKMAKNVKKKTPTMEDIDKALKKKKHELIHSSRPHPTFLKHFVIYLNGSMHAIESFMSRYKNRITLYFYHALRNTQSPLECYFSCLRSMDHNNRISGSNITDK